MIRRLSPLVLLVLSACHSGAAIRASVEVVKTDIERARRAGAMRCAPKELATAEANVDFTAGELDQGNSRRAFEHVTIAEDAAKKALAIVRDRKDCTLKQVVVKEVVVKITENDSDGDGLLDKDDACPKLAGPIENKGCPLEGVKDRDNDGVADANDRCPDQPEDLDNFQDDDGCPETDNDNDGVIDAADKCPNVAGPIPNMGCPVTDKDNDGISDERDKCPNEPEDKDGYEDEDGCPDLDNDNDGLPDATDKCPIAAEDKDGYQDEDGCPDPDNDKDEIVDEKDECPNDPGPVETKGCPKKYKFVEVTREKIEIKKQINFATGSAKIIGAQSTQILKDVAQALNDAPRIKKIRIEGHTDSQGDDIKNLRLSQARADSVMAALIKMGIDPGRMESVGFGETKPIASNATAAGRAENRRTEFNILEQ